MLLKRLVVLLFVVACDDAVDQLPDAGQPDEPDAVGLLTPDAAPAASNSCTASLAIDCTSLPCMATLQADFVCQTPVSTYAKFGLIAEPSNGNAYVADTTYACDESRSFEFPVPCNTIFTGIVVAGSEITCRSTPVIADCDP